MEAMNSYEFAQWLGRILLNGLLIITFTTSLIGYLWDNRKELKENWRK